MNLPVISRRSILFLLIASCTLVSGSDPILPKWLLMSSGHFTVLTDAPEKKGIEVALRLEQMRSVVGQLLMKNKLSMPEPLDVIAFKDYSEYAQVAPQQDGRAISAQGFFVPGHDRNYIVLSVADEESWLAVTHQFAHLYLNYNYPQTQPWFDEGFAEYFSSLRLMIFRRRSAATRNLSPKFWTRKSGFHCRNYSTPN